MRNVLSLAVLLFLFFTCCLICFSAVAAAKYRCVFDSIASRPGQQSIATVSELPQKRQIGTSYMTTLLHSNDSWAPIRFRVFTEDLYNYSSYCTAEGQWRPDFKGSRLQCEELDILTPERRNFLVRHIIPKAVKLHAERLLVQPLRSTILVPKYEHDICSQFTIPFAHQTEGVVDSDMVLYVAAGLHLYRNRVAAWATACTSLLNGRPVIGVTNLNSRILANKEDIVRAVAHEIAHTLGFSFESFRKLRMLEWKTNVRGKPGVFMLNSSKAVEKAREHYNCTNITAVELEDEGEKGTIGSHWEMRNAKDELMAPIVGAGYYTSLTMAAFEDLGFYRANWSMAETMGWGKNAGCRLLEEKCVTNSKSNFPDMFCRKRNKNSYGFCTSDRLALGFCPISKHDYLYSRYQYFKNPRYSGRSDCLADFCPFILPYFNRRCSDGQLKNMIGSRIGPLSRCFKGKNLHYKGERIGDVCADVFCDGATVYVRYLSDDTWHRCVEGRRITPKGNFTAGKILCPKYYEVCR